MSQFITRIELHAASERDYEILRMKMLAIGFASSIKADNGLEYQLPTAEFIIEGNYSLTQVYDLAERATRGTRRQNVILVVHSKGITFKLNEVQGRRIPDPVTPLTTALFT